MSNNNPAPPQTTMILRLLGGAYLVYLAWSLRGAALEQPLYWIAIVVFSAVGAWLMIRTGLQLYHHEYFRADSTQVEASEEAAEESEENPNV